MLSRRRFLAHGLSLGGLALGAESPASGQAARRSAPAADLTLRELELEGAGGSSRPTRALLLIPAHGPPSRRYPALVLLHGRGEVGDEHVGIHAWRTRYGLAESYARLLRPPIRKVAEDRGYLAERELTVLNARLAADPFQGIVVICPVTPHPASSGAPERTLDAYAAWVADTLLPAARAAAPIQDPPAVGLDGCSMGGYVAAEVFARRPEAFRTFGVVQPAIGGFRAPGYARHLAGAARHSKLRGIHLLTSSKDPYRAATERLGREIERLGAQATLTVLPGPHDQRWLRAAGSLLLLRWHERNLRQPSLGSRLKSPREL